MTERQGGSTGRQQALAAIAERLRTAEERCVAIPPIAGDVPDLTIAEAYGVQVENINRKLASGDRITGKKIGLTSQAMQDLLGVHQPDYGHLLASMLVEGDSTPRGTLVQPRVEAEIAFILADDLPASGVTVADVLAATAYVVPAIEIVDSRIADWKIGILDTVADNASSGRYLLGTVRANPREVDLRQIGMVLSKNGVQVNSGTGAAVLGDPVYSVAWLANALGEYGVRLSSGEVVLSGAMSAMVPVDTGDVMTASYDLFGELSITFV